VTCSRLVVFSVKQNAIYVLMYALTLEKGRKALMDFSCLFCSDSKYILYIDSALTIYLSCNVKKKSKTIVKHYWICFRQASFQSFQICLFSHPRYSWLIICIVDIKSNGIFIYCNWLWNKTDILLKVASNTNNCNNTILGLFVLLHEKSIYLLNNWKVGKPSVTYFRL
jgi:hypothetical protein